MAETKLSGTDSQHIAIHLTAADRAAQLAADVRRGLTATPKELPPKWFYDETGSLLFDEITCLPEYYPTRCERAILTAHAPEIAAFSRADTLIELGSGTSEKTQLLLDALRDAGSLRRFVPFDVDETVLRYAADTIRTRHPALRVSALVGDFDHHLDFLPSAEARLVAFLGSTIGNMRPDERHTFLSRLRATASDGDVLLLGVDLVKDPRRLVAAYDDPSGVTAAFNANVLTVVNRELGGDLNPQNFVHVAAWNPDAEWIEMRLRSIRAQTARIAALDLTVPFEADEQMRTEISAKFRRDGIEKELADAGWSMTHWWTDPDGDFAVSLSVPI
ncbi:MULTISPECIES: L-histidine N(alpha)-methyltransferase [unclassified Pseudofrankia]|uniref:L-histidine N(alpha)-methyltransferase n=1 Tax=unclassified Pseudofrankia TaxID=2994372 RepID=UPI0008D97798|nr:MULTISPECIES: L-histidine N(alpha)-methyltransferase [unclassified Pseudofrankia]MDT3442528.1 L-histidine N(alpha)-methyltransferase [Pseudofrankia sp. BMG5.37]OHV74689.1 dimethylhistidine N-methyltransferase [Pseudofrankia sp. BMG5.36]